MTAFVRATTVMATALTEREWQVMLLIAQGKTNEQIAILISRSIKTVQSHRDRIKKKTGFCRDIDIALQAQSQGLIEVKNGKVKVVNGLQNDMRPGARLIWTKR